MIPEQYWRIIGRWFWLIGGIALATSVLAMAAEPLVLGRGGAGYSAATTLGVSRMVSFGGTVTFGLNGDPQILASYTESIAARGSSLQFLSALGERLRAAGVVRSDTQLARNVDVVANPGLFRIDITARDEDPEVAAIVAQTAADILIDDVAAEEARIKASLTESATQQQTALLNQLNSVYTARMQRLAALGEPALREGLDNLVRAGIGADLSGAFTTLVQDFARITSDPELAVLNSQATSLEQQLAALSDNQRSFSDEILLGTPVSLVNPVQTVPVPPSPSLRTRDLGLMGLIAGLVLGWIAATMAEGWYAGQQLGPGRRDGWDSVPIVSSLKRYSSGD